MDLPRKMLKRTKAGRSYFSGLRVALHRSTWNPQAELSGFSQLASLFMRSLPLACKVDAVS